MERYKQIISVLTILNEKMQNGEIKLSLMEGQMKSPMTGELKFIGLGFNVKEFINGIDLNIMFFEKDGNDGFDFVPAFSAYDPKEKLLPLMVVLNEDLSKEGLKKVFVDYSGLFVHELTHYFDHKEGLVEDFIPKSKMEYFTNPAEVNAYFMQGIHRTKIFGGQFLDQLWADFKSNVDDDLLNDLNDRFELMKENGLMGIKIYE